MPRMTRLAVQDRLAIPASPGPSPPPNETSCSYNLSVLTLRGGFRVRPFFFQILPEKMDMNSNSLCSQHLLSTFPYAKHWE